MALIEFKQCPIHGHGNHTNGNCWECYLKKNAEEADKMRDDREAFENLSTDEKLMKLYDIIKGIYP